MKRRPPVEKKLEEVADMLRERATLHHAKAHLPFCTLSPLLDGPVAQFIAVSKVKEQFVKVRFTLQ